MNKRFGIIVLLVVILLILFNYSFVVVDETQQAIKLRFGTMVGKTLKPGLHFRIPGVDKVPVYPKLILDYDAAPAEILTKDKKNLVVDNYAKWRIVEPLTFFETVQTVGQAQARLDDIIFAELRVELGRHLMIEIISELRPEIMEAVTKRSDAKSRELGISVVDVRIKRADLPQENTRAVFGRMKAEREREAKKYRSEGQEAALKLRADADRQRTIILAEAYRKSEELKGQGDAEATSIYAGAFEQDAEFFSFLRTLESYRKALNEKTTLILSQEDEFLRLLKDSGADLEAVQPGKTQTPGPTAQPEPTAAPSEPETAEPEPEEESAPTPSEQQSETEASQ